MTDVAGVYAGPEQPTGRAAFGGRGFYWGNQDMTPRTWRQIFEDIGGGTGASVSSTGNSEMDQALLRRMQYQDKAVMMLLLLAYAGSMVFSASIAYRQSFNDSPVTYYADPRYHDMSIDTNDIQGFLQAFNRPPKECYLQVTGLNAIPPFPDAFVDSAVEWLGAHYRVAFAFALDLSPWMVRATESEEAEPSATAGVETEDVDQLNEFMQHDSNDLACVAMQMDVNWKDWEELATNIKMKIRQAGFTGVICVHHTHQDLFHVYKNRPWANFMHCRTTKVLCALSLVGWLFYQPYMWVRNTALTVRCKYTVDIGPGQYWPLIADKIGPDGFTTIEDVPTMFRQYR